MWQKEIHAKEVYSITVNNDFTMKPITDEEGKLVMEVTTHYHGFCPDVVETFDDFTEIKHGLEINFNYDECDINIVRTLFKSLIRKAGGSSNVCK